MTAPHRKTRTEPGFSGPGVVGGERGGLDMFTMRASLLFIKIAFPFPKDEGHAGDLRTKQAVENVALTSLAVAG